MLITTGTNTTRVMHIIWSDTPKSEFIVFQPVKKPLKMTPNLHKLKGNVIKLDQKFDRCPNLVWDTAQGMEEIVMQYCTVLTILSIVIIIIVLLFQERKQSDLKPFANFDM